MHNIHQSLLFGILAVVIAAEAVVQTDQAEVPEEEEEIAKNEHTTALSILDSLLRQYDRRATPTNHLGKATQVECKLYVRSLGSINPDTMDYQVDLYLRQHWLDPRLHHPQLLEPLDLNDPNLVKAIWKPEVYFPNAKDAEFQYVTVPNVLVRIDPGGQILYMLRLKLKFSCMMELSKFPLDEQVCTMEIASFSKTTKELVLRWKEDNPVDISGEVKMPQFEIFKVVPAKCQETFHIGNYSCLLAELHLKRSLGFHMVQSYLPTILIVVISWVSFWMDVDSVAGRTTLGVTTLLTVSSKASDVQAEVPLVSYVKAIDIWMGACTGFIFAALLEFTLTNYMWRKGHKGRVTDTDCGPSTRGKKMGFVPVAAAATAAATGLDPSMFTSMVAAGAAAAAATTAVKRSKSGHSIDLEEDEMPLTSPAHNLLKKRQTNRKESEMMELQQQVDVEQQQLNGQQEQQLQFQHGNEEEETLFCNDVNGRFVDTEVVAKGPRGVDCRVVSFDNKAIDAEENKEESSFCRLAIRIDELSRLLFPLSFVLFNILYWSYYTQWTL